MTETAQRIVTISAAAAVACAIGVGYTASSGASSSSIGGDVIYEIDRHVDARRYVETATMQVRPDGSLALHFAARRTDITSDVVEQWAVHYDSDKSFDRIYHLYVDGQWIYTSGHGTSASGSAVSRLSIPNQSAMVDVAHPCDEIDLQMYQVIFAQVESQIDVVGEIVTEIALSSVNTAEYDPGGYADCMMDCPNIPICSGDLTCQEQHDCCTGEADAIKCSDDCYCNNVIEAPPPWVQFCLNQNASAHASAKHRCDLARDRCLSMTPCK